MLSSIMSSDQITPKSDLITDADPESKPREKWSSRMAFYFAAVGSAVGFGNVWRFPSLSYRYGGGAFFIPYLLALFLIGIPVLFLEIALGQFYQTGEQSNVSLRSYFIFF
jgi:SNF family Na+-dependent transporter